MEEILNKQIIFVRGLRPNRALVEAIPIARARGIVQMVTSGRLNSCKPESYSRRRAGRLASRGRVLCFFRRPVNLVRSTAILPIRRLMGV